MLYKENIVILILVVFVIGYFLYEKISYILCRKKLKYVIHVNGTRGKSTVTRMIHEGLYNAGYKVYAKTTGTLPMVIDTKRNEKLIKRIGKANIKEQIKIVKDAVKDKAEILVIECMAVLPEIQYASENSILKADVMALTNIRLDHMDVMGDSIESTEEVLSNSIPKNAILFTSEEKNIDIVEKKCKINNTKFVKVDTRVFDDDFDFKENIALATQTCKYIGAKEVNIKNFIRDPYALSKYEWNGRIFINGFSINDKESILKIYDKLNLKGKLVLLINNRYDRGFRVNEMMKIVKELKPYKVYVTGSNKLYVKNMLKDINVECLRNIDDIDKIEKDVNVFAIGNIANEGIKIVEKIKKEGEQIVY